MRKRGAVQAALFIALRLGVAKAFGRQTKCRFKPEAAIGFFA